MLEKQVMSVIVTRFGKLKVVESNGGIEHLQFLEHNDSTEPSENPGELANEAKLCIERLEWKPPHFPPLSIKGTEFQMSVWSELCKIPLGSTITYAELAKRVGKPNAARAVANACERIASLFSFPVIGLSLQTALSEAIGVAMKERVLDAERRAVERNYSSISR